MSRDKPSEYSQLQMVPCSLDDQLMPGTLEYAIHSSRRQCPLWARIARMVKMIMMISGMMAARRKGLSRASRLFMSVGAWRWSARPVTVTLAGASSSAFMASAVG